MQLTVYHFEQYLRGGEVWPPFHRESPGAGTQVFRVSGNTYLYELSHLAGLVSQDVMVNIDAHLIGLRIHLEGKPRDMPVRVHTKQMN